MWILLTLLAAFMQAWRNAFQSQLSKEVSVAGVTLARFIWAGPIAAVYLASLYLWQDVGIPDFSDRFIGFILGASAMQILATGLMVKLFKPVPAMAGPALSVAERLRCATRRHGKTATRLLPGTRPGLRPAASRPASHRAECRAAD